MDYDKILEKFNKIEDKNEACFKCGKIDVLYEDPNIEGLYFCKECWKERLITEILEKHGYEDEIPYDD